eukprot:g3828.t1
MSAGASAEEARSALQDLMREKDRLEANIEALTEFLSSGNMPGLKGGLIDADGFPRADIDLYQVRDARHKIACYQNDHKAVMRKIEEGLCNLHAVSKVSVPIAGGKSRKEGGEGDAASASAAKRLKLGVGPPFAVIDSVSPGSPAEAAGVQANDFLKKFGTITLGAPNGPQTVADCFREIRSQVVEGRPLEAKESPSSPSATQQRSASEQPRQSAAERKLYTLQLPPEEADGDRFSGLQNSSVLKATTKAGALRSGARSKANKAKPKANPGGGTKAGAGENASEVKELPSSARGRAGAESPRPPKKGDEKAIAVSPEAGTTGTRPKVIRKAGVPAASGRAAAEPPFPEKRQPGQDITTASASSSAATGKAATVRSPRGAAPAVGASLTPQSTPRVLSSRTLPKVKVASVESAKARLKKLDDKAAAGEKAETKGASAKAQPQAGEKAAPGGTGDKKAPSTSQRVFGFAPSSLNSMRNNSQQGLYSYETVVQDEYAARPKISLEGFATSPGDGRGSEDGLLCTAEAGAQGPSAAVPEPAPATGHAAAAAIARESDKQRRNLLGATANRKASEVRPQLGLSEVRPVERDGDSSAASLRPRERGAVSLPPMKAPPAAARAETTAKTRSTTAPKQAQPTGGLLKVPSPPAAGPSPRLAALASPSPRSIANQERASAPAPVPVGKVIRGGARAADPTASAARAVVSASRAPSDPDRAAPVELSAQKSVPADYTAIGAQQQVLNGDRTGSRITAQSTRSGSQPAGPERRSTTGKSAKSVPASALASPARTVEVSSVGGPVPTQAAAAASENATSQEVETPNTPDKGVSAAGQMRSSSGRAQDDSTRPGARATALQQRRSAPADTSSMKAAKLSAVYDDDDEPGPSLREILLSKRATIGTESEVALAARSPSVDVAEPTTLDIRSGYGGEDADELLATAGAAVGILGAQDEADVDKKRSNKLNESVLDIRGTGADPRLPTYKELPARTAAPLAEYAIEEGVPEKSWFHTNARTGRYVKEPPAPSPQDGGLGAAPPGRRPRTELAAVKPRRALPKEDLFRPDATIKQYDMHDAKVEENDVEQLQAPPRDEPEEDRSYGSAIKARTSASLYQPYNAASEFPEMQSGLNANDEEVVEARIHRGGPADHGARASNLKTSLAGNNNLQGPIRGSTVAYKKSVTLPEDPVAEVKIVEARESTTTRRTSSTPASKPSVKLVQDEYLVQPKMSVEGFVPSQSVGEAPSILESTSDTQPREAEFFDAEEEAEDEASEKIRGSSVVQGEYSAQPKMSVEGFVPSSQPPAAAAPLEASTYDLDAVFIFLLADAGAAADAFRGPCGRRCWHDLRRGRRAIAAAYDRSEAVDKLVCFRTREVPAGTAGNGE